MIRCLLLHADSQKSPQAQRIRRPPSDSSLGIDPFKIAHQQQTKIDSRRQRRPPHVARVKLRALPLGKLIKLLFFQQFVHSCVKRMCWPLRNFLLCDPDLLLSLSSPPRSHSHRQFSENPFRILHRSPRQGSYFRLQKPLFTTGCYGARSLVTAQEFHQPSLASYFPSQNSSL